MTKNYVTVVFDRKKTAAKNGTGKIELQVRLTRTCRKYIVVDECSPIQWRTRRINKDVFEEQHELRRLLNLWNVLVNQ